MLVIAWMVTVLAVLSACWNAFRLWRDRASHLSGWPLTVLRALPLLSGLVAMILVGVLVITVVDEPGSIIGDAAAYICMVCLVLLFTLLPIVAFRGHPRRLVAPHLRRRS